MVEHEGGADPEALVESPGRKPAKGAERGFGWSIPVGRIAGIPVYAHVTLVAFLALWIVVAVASGSPAGAAAALVVGVFASVLLHELAHSLVARRGGARVEGITLLPFGGVSSISDVQEGSRRELVMAAAGPATSWALAGLLGVAAELAGQRVWPPSIFEGPLVARLAWLNLILGVFNLVPAFPMDGGRMLRDILALRSHDVLGATRTSVLVSRLLSSLMIGIGFFVNLWLALIGVFVLLSAGQEERALRWRLTLRGRTAGSLARPLPVLDPRVSISDARAGLPWGGGVPFAVAAEGEIIGIAPPGALAYAADPMAAVGSLAVAVPVVPPETPAFPDLVAAMSSQPMGVALVASAGRVVGVVALRELGAMVGG